METFRMSGKERRRLEVLSRVEAGDISLAKGAELLGLSYRQLKRCRARRREQGDAGLLHRLRGRSSNRQARPSRQEEVVALYRQKYAGYGPTLAAECLKQDDALAVPVSTLRVWLTAAGLWQRERRRKLHRRRRPRREHCGELLQMDGSHHDWFEGRRGWAVLMVMIDDATGRVFARFFENESWDSAATTLRYYVQRHGLPRALYVDRHSIYRSDREPTPDETLAGIEPESQFGRAMRQLEVELILAHSPQAKGRVERVNRTLQDRLVKELTRRGIRDLDVANRYLEETYLPRFNEQFVKPAARAADLHRQIADEQMLRTVSLQEDRVVQPDWMVRWQNGFLQLRRATAEWVQPGDGVIVSQQLDSPLRIFVGDRELAWTTACETAAPLAKPATRRGPTGSSQGQKPRASHPWRRRQVAAIPAAAVVLGCSTSVAALPSFHSPTPQQPR